MTREDLLALNLTDEQVQAILSEFDILHSEIDILHGQIALRDKRDAVMALIPGFKPRDAQLILRLIDLDKITIEEGKVNGLSEQIQALKACAPYLFLEMPDPAGGSAAGGACPADFDMNTFLRGEN